jgi:hypothetical protein
MTTTISVIPIHWKKFQVLAASRGLSKSALIRLMITQELRKAAIEAKTFDAPTRGRK